MTCSSIGWRSCSIRSRPGGCSSRTSAWPADASGLTAAARGEPIDRRRHEMDMEVKAITYHGLKVQRDGDGWLAEVIVDI